MCIIEVCVQDVEGVKAATDAGADRVELCAELWCGGVTPSVETIEEALTCAPPQGLRILVRENRESFELSDQEAQKQADDILTIREKFGASGVPVGFVVGGLRNGQLNLRWLDLWREAAGEHTLIFHRAFDELELPCVALEKLHEHGWDGVLTTGADHGKADMDGLRGLLGCSDGRMDIVGSGGIRKDNVAQVLQETGLREVHFRAPLGDTDQTDPQMVVDTVKAVRG